MWDAVNFNCSVGTTLQYCYDIEKDPIVSAGVRSWMAWVWRTMEEKHYPLIAKNAQCVKTTVEQAQYYWRMVAGSMEMTATVGVAIGVLTMLI